MKHYLLLMTALLSYFLIDAQVVYEDFEAGGQLTWEAVNGTYNGIIANPDMAGINTSDNVGSYTKSGEHSFSLFRSQQGAALDISENNIFRLQVWSPVETEVLLKLEGGGNAAEDRRQITEDSTWVEYIFDFRGKADVTTLTDIIIFFAPGNNEDSST